MQLCVYDHDDIDTINIGRASHQECEGRCHRAMLAVTVHISCSHLLQPFSWMSMLSWYFPYMTSLRKISEKERHHVWNTCAVWSLVLTTMLTLTLSSHLDKPEISKCLGWIPFSGFFSRVVLKNKDFGGVLLKSSISQEFQDVCETGKEYPEIINTASTVYSLSHILSESCP